MKGDLRNENSWTGFGFGDSLRGNHMWVIFAAYLIGRCNLFEMNAMAIAFFVAVCLQNGNAFFVFGALLLGMASCFSMGMIVRYAVLMGILLLLFCNRKLILLKREKLLAALLAGTVTILVNAFAYRFAPQLLQMDSIKLTQIIGSSFVVNVFAEGVLVFS